MEKGFISGRIFFFFFLVAYCSSLLSMIFTFEMHPFCLNSFAAAFSSEGSGQTGSENGFLTVPRSEINSKKANWSLWKLKISNNNLDIARDSFCESGNLQPKTFNNCFFPFGRRWNREAEATEYQAFIPCPMDLIIAITEMWLTSAVLET